MCRMIFLYILHEKLRHPIISQAKLPEDNHHTPCLYDGHVTQSPWILGKCHHGVRQTSLTNAWKMLRLKSQSHLSQGSKRNPQFFTCTVKSGTRDQLGLPNYETVMCLRLAMSQQIPQHGVKRCEECVRSETSKVNKDTQGWPRACIIMINYPLETFDCFRLIVFANHICFFTAQYH